MKYLLTFTAFLILSSCSPQLHYLGDTLPQTNHIDTYYSPDDIERKFRVLGQLENNSNHGVFSLDDIRDKMIEEAKLRGADAILFLNSNSFDNQHHVEADLLLYKK